jgi:lysophospholipase L1-like esterase
VKYLTLLGDSVFDNAHYNPPREGSLAWFRRFAPEGWDVVLGAADGATLSSIPFQVRRIHPDSKAVLLSVGGNDAMMDKWRLTTFKGRPMWRSIRVAAANFGIRYERMLQEFEDLPIPLTVCTIYGGDFGEEQNLINAAVSLFNRQISKLARREGWGVLDNFSLLRGEEFFTGGIEPSSLGSATMAHNFWKRIL